MVLRYMVTKHRGNNDKDSQNRRLGYGMEDMQSYEEIAGKHAQMGLSEL
jgi:hypothetical protein